MTIPKSMYCTCQRCKNVWIRRVMGVPVRCPKCKSRYWKIAKGKLRIGRPKGKKVKA